MTAPHILLRRCLTTPRSPPISLHASLHHTGQCAACGGTNLPQSRLGEGGWETCHPTTSTVEWCMPKKIVYIKLVLVQAYPKKKVGYLYTCAIESRPTPECSDIMMCVLGPATQHRHPWENPRAVSLSLSLSLSHPTNTTKSMEFGSVAPANPGPPASQ